MGSAKQGMLVRLRGCVAAVALIAAGVVAMDTQASLLDVPVCIENGLWIEPGCHGAYELATLGVLDAQGNRPEAFIQNSISLDGRSLAFISQATNFVLGDTNGQMDVFVRDLDRDRTEIASRPPLKRTDIPSLGIQHSEIGFDRPSLSANGRYVAFTARGLFAEDSDIYGGPYVYDRATRRTTRPSLGIGGEPNRWVHSPMLSGDGRFVAFQTGATNIVPNDTNGADDVFLYDRESGVTIRASVASDGSQSSAPPGTFLNAWLYDVSGDGRYVLFSSQATNLVPGDMNGREDVFVHDRLTPSTTRVSIALGGAESTGISQGGDISADGRFVAFGSQGRLVPEDTDSRWDVYLLDRQSGALELVSVSVTGQPEGDVWPRGLSDDGRFVALESVASTLVFGDTNGLSDVFVRDRATATTTRVSLSADGEQLDRNSERASMSADGRYIAFATRAQILAKDKNIDWDVYVLDRAAPPADVPLITIP